MATRRSYRSTRREQQAGQTRAAIVDAAARLFAERGWSATGMRDIASEAGVAVETVYATVGTKADLLHRVIDVAVVGDDDPVPLSDRPEFQALGHGDLHQRCAAAARLVAALNQRGAGVHRAFSHAAATDPVLAEEWKQNQARQRRSTREGATLVLGRRPPRTVVDAVWALTGPEVFHLLVGVAGWSQRQYERWLADAIFQALRALEKEEET